MKTKTDKIALAKRFLQLGEQERAKFITLLDSKGMNFEKLPIVAVDNLHSLDTNNTLAPLSPAQKRMWDIYELDAANSAYHMSGAFDVRGELNVSSLEKALLKVVDKHQILRTRFIFPDLKKIKPNNIEANTTENEVRQYVEKQTLIQMDSLDYSSQSKENLQSLCQAFIAKPFDLYHQTPVRLQCIKTGEQAYRIQIVMHHLVSDGWSIGLFMKDLVAAYQGVPLVPLDIQYHDYAIWQDALLKAGKDKAHLAFWEKELGTQQPKKLYSWHKEVALNQRREAGTLSFQLTSQQHNNISQLARQLSVTTSSFWLGLWQTALAKATGHEDIRIGMPMANRHRPEVADIIGFFVNTMVIRQTIIPSSTLSQSIKSSHEKVLLAQDHQLLPFDQIVSSFSRLEKEKTNNDKSQNTKRLAGETPLFQVLFNHQVDATSMIQLEQGVNISPINQQGEFALFDIALDIRESLTSDIVLTYARDRIDTEQMTKLYSILQCLLEKIDTKLNQSLAQIQILTQAESTYLERLSLPSMNNEGEWQYQAITTLIDKHALEQPDSIAIKHGQQSYTFAELAKRSNQLAHYLLGQGVKRDEPVGVLFERGVEMVVAMLSIMKAGGAFLPLDPDYPKERLAYMLEDSGAKWVLSNRSENNEIEDTWKSISSHFVTSSIEHILLDTLKLSLFPEANPDVHILPKQLAYIIYTSGSTGKPKGVAIHHQGLSMHVQTIGKQYNMTPNDIELHFASISFDGAVERWTVPLAFGSKLIIRDQQLWSAEKTCQVLQDERVTVACFPPSYIAPLLDWIEQVRPELHVRSWTLGGEAFTKETYNRMQRLLAPPRIINGYGPTETVVTPMIWRSDASSTSETYRLDSAYAPIGQTVGERRLYVLDNQLNRVAAGDVGELYIGGEVGLARGYLHKPELTSERFLPDLFMNNGERMYRTGDLVRWNKDHLMEYLGRVDQQIKIRGFRIELGEIENRLQQLSNVETCLVNLDTSFGKSQLIGYLHDTNSSKALTDKKSERLLDELAKQLPDYMVPSRLIWLDNLPLTPAGKIDRKALPLPTIKSNNVAYVAPTTRQEILLAELWQQLLSIESANISKDSHFFALGGDSILCLQLVSKLKISGFSITPKQVFATPVLYELALELSKVEAAQQKALPTKPFGLMPIQAHFMAQNFSVPNHWNQAICVELKQEMDLAGLNQALNTLVNHHPSLRLAFSKLTLSNQPISEQAHQWQQRFVPFEERDLLWLEKVENETEFDKFAHRIQTSLDIEKGQLLQAGYAKIKGKADRLLLVIHHMAVDGVSWRVLFDDLWTAYQQIVAGQKATLPINYASLDMAIEQLEQWQQSDYGQQRQAFWQEHSSLENDDQPNQPALYADKKVITIELNTRQTHQLLNAKQDIVSVLLAALPISSLASISSSNESKPKLTLYLEGHGREESVFGDLDLSRLVGWMTSLYPVTLHATQSAKDIQQQLSHTKEDGGIGFGLRYLPQEGGNQKEKNSQKESVTLTFNYLGQYQDSGFSHWCTPVEQGIGGYSQSPLNTMLTPLVINTQVVEGKLSANWEYASSHYQANEINDLADQWRTALSQQIEALSQAPVSADINLIQQLNNEASNKSSPTPVFCIHPVTGRVMGYQKLAQALDDKRIVYGIQSQSFAYGNCFDTSFSHMADVYTATIQEIQPYGPYTLIGWSLGGALCQEVAARLERKGEVIEFIGLLDCYVPGTEIAEDQWQSPKAKETLISHLELLLGQLNHTQKNSCLQAFNSTTAEHWPNAFNQWLQHQHFDQHTAENARQMLFSWAVEQHMRALCNQYHLPKIETPLHTYWAGLPQKRNILLKTELNNINTLATSKVYDTDHQGIVQNSEVIKDLVASLLNTSLLLSE